MVLETVWLFSNVVTNYLQRKLAAIFRLHLIHVVHLASVLTELLLDLEGLRRSSPLEASVVARQTKHCPFVIYYPSLQQLLKKTRPGNSGAQLCLE